MGEMDYKKTTFQGLLGLMESYNPEADTDLVKKAFKVGMNPPLKRDGEKFCKPQLEHFLDTAKILVDLRLDDETIAASLLHETLMLGVPYEKLESEFGKSTAIIVKEYTQLSEIIEKNRNAIPDDKLSTVMLAIARDIRSVFIRLALLLDSLRMVECYSEKKRLEIAKAAISIYMPVCHKLGLTQIEWEMQDRCFKIINPQAYEKIKKYINKKRSQRETEVQETIEELSSLLKKEYDEISILGRVKNFYGVYNKMMRTGKKISEINDLMGIRVLCRDEECCYKVLGAIHSNYTYLPEYFDDYISRSKKNLYKSIHTTVLWKGKPLEIQIRTEKMHQDAEGGIASHWRYKKYMEDKRFDRKLSWARQLVEWNKTKDLSKILKSIEMQSGEREIFVLTPKKAIIALPEDSTPVDFAFAVHSEIGYKCEKAKVNGKIVPLDFKLNNGDIVEIEESKAPQVKRAWLSFVKLEKAKKKIRQKLQIKLQKTKKATKEIKLPKGEIRLAKCCSPLPEDEVVAYRTTKRKIIVHRKDCKNTEKLPKNKIVKMPWGNKSGTVYGAEIKIKANDRNGLLGDLLNVLYGENIDILKTEAKSHASGLISCNFKINIDDYAKLKKIMEALANVESVHDVERV